MTTTPTRDRSSTASGRRRGGRHPHLPAAVAAVVASSALLGVGIASGRPNWPVYAVVLSLGAGAIAVLDDRVHLSQTTVWGLVAFGVGHAAGGMVPVGDATLYSVWLVDDVVRYDNLQHAVGFGFVGRAVWEALAPRLAPRPADLPRVAVWVIVLGAAAGGALNEIVEYVMVLTIPGTDVGGYDNTARDLIANLLGGIVVGSWTGWQLRRRYDRDAAPGDLGPEIASDPTSRR